MTKVPQLRFRFTPFHLDPAAFRLWRGDVAVPLAPKAFDLLVLLVSHPAAMVSKDAIMRTLWPDIAVTDNALTQVVSDLRQALGDDSASPRFIETVPRRGYRFVAAVETIAPEAPASQAPVQPAVAARSRRPSSSSSVRLPSTRGTRRRGWVSRTRASGASKCRARGTVPTPCS
jgi:DNA-binding winged helix-turn-helix (wHTH) protein